MNKFCKYLSNGYQFQIGRDNTVTHAPCCHYTERVSVSKVIEFRDKIKNITGWTAECNYCKYTESLSHNSLRLQSDKFLQTDDDLTLSLQLDITCNGGCVICGPHLSTYWQSQFKKFNIDSLLPIKLHVENKVVDEILNAVDLQKCNRVLFSGGEALLSTHDLEILSSIINKSRVTVHYITNGSIKPSKARIALWAEFKEVKLICSIDAIGTQFEYIRYPLVWDEVEANLFTMRDTLPESVTFGINHTATAVSLYSTDRFINWVETKFAVDRFGRKIGYVIHPAHGTWNLNCMPIALKEAILVKYGANSLVGKLANSSTYNADSRNALAVFTKEWDNNRNLHWEDIFPDILQYMT